MKILVCSDNSKWIVDMITNNYKLHSRLNFVDMLDRPDMFLCFNMFGFPTMVDKVKPFCNLSYFIIHHINEEKIHEYDFSAFNKANGSICCSDRTKNIASKYIKIPIHVLPYWINSEFTQKPKSFVSDMRYKFKSHNEVLIGSFQKDGEGKVGDKPKLSKGPDVFVNVLKKLSSFMKIKVILSGYARQYVISNLEKMNIPYVYLPRYDDINSLYDCLDWYFVTSRCEGGPQAILEASYRKIKILSTDVGIASNVLHPDCICKNVDDFVNKVRQGTDRIEHNYTKVVENHLPEKIIPIWDDFLERQVL